MNDLDLPHLKAAMAEMSPKERKKFEEMLSCIKDKCDAIDARTVALTSAYDVSEMPKPNVLAQMGADLDYNLPSERLQCLVDRTRNEFLIYLDAYQNWQKSQPEKASGDSEPDLIPTHWSKSSPDFNKNKHKLALDTDPYYIIESLRTPQNIEAKAYERRMRAQAIPIKMKAWCKLNGYEFNVEACYKEYVDEYSLPEEEGVEKS